MVSGSRGQVVSDRPESGQGVVEADGVLGIGHVDSLTPTVRVSRSTYSICP